MAAREIKYERIDNNRRRNYVQTREDGNTVRHVEAVPRRVDQEERRRIQQDHAQRKARRERALRINASYAAFMFLICAFFVGVSVNYLKLQATGITFRNVIASKEAELNNLKLANDDAYEKVMAQVDMTEVKRIALNELGLKYAEEGQIIPYNSQNGDYIRQYGEITTE